MNEFTNSRVARRDFVRAIAAAGFAGAAPGQDSPPAGPDDGAVELQSPPRPVKQRPTTWLGSLTDSGAILRAKLPAGVRARVVVEEAAGGEPHTFPAEEQPIPSNVARFHIHGLKADTEYRYFIEMTGRRTSFPEGTLRTAGKAGQPWSFHFAFGSCAATGSRHEVFTTILRRKPSLFLHLGDMHYCNISRDDVQLYRAAWDSVLASPEQAALYRSVPFASTWDDHDFGPNGSDARAPGRKAACAIYREYAPVKFLPDYEAIYHAFSIGRVRFIMTDLRSQRSPEAMTEDKNKTLLGTRQKAWLFNELKTASRSHGLIFLISSVPWIGSWRGGGDSWLSYATERREIAQFLAVNAIRNVCILCGDAHMLAADDGTNSDFSGTGTLKIPVLHGSALDQGGSIKGGPYSHGTHASGPGEGCFGWVSVKDDGGRIRVEYTGRNHEDREHIALGFDVG